MIKKIIHILLIFAALVSLIAGAIAVTFRIAFPDSKLQEMFQNTARWYLQRGVSLKSLSLGICTGIELTGLEISEQPDFVAGTFFSAGRVHLKMPLLPLLHHSVRISELRVENPQVRIARLKGGKLNFEDLRIVYGSPEKTGDVLKVAVPGVFHVADARVTNGTLQYTDAALRGLHVELSHIDISARNVSLLEPFDARVSFVVAGTKTPVRVRLSVDVPHDRVVLSEGVAGAGNEVLNFSGSLGNLTGSGELTLSLDVEGNPAVLNDLCGILPLKADISLFPLPRLHARISGTSGALSIKFLK